MKKSLKLMVAGILAAACILPATAAAKIKRNLKPASGWNLYLPGNGNPKDVLKDLNKAGWQVSNSYAEHFSLLDSDINKKKVLRFSTIDGKQDAIMLPLTGNEKLVTLIFKAQGSVDPDSTTTPYGILYAYVQNGAWQTLIRHNSSNQLKGSKNMSRLREPEGPGDIVSGWHDYRIVFDLSGGPENMKAEIFIDGVKRHSDTCSERTDFTTNPEHPEFDTSKFNWDMMLGRGNYLEFGDNDGSTNAFGRYAYFLTVIDEDVSAMSLEELGAKVKADLVSVPVIKNDRPPESKRPAKKPAYINIQGPEVNSKDSAFYDVSTINGTSLKLNKLPNSRADSTKVINPAPVVPEMTFAATVEPTGKDGAYKTISEAISAVPENSAIKILPGFYYEKIKITKPGISLIGTDPAKTMIYGFESDTGSIDGNILVEVNYLPGQAGGIETTTAAAEIPESPAANCYFNAMNITFYNKGAEWNAMWGGAERRSITLALKGVDKCYLENCVFIGQQDTLYWRSGRIYAKNCYVEGDVDYVCGGATAYFDNCMIYSLNYINGCIIVAGANPDTGYKSTSAYANGYVFNNCIITGAKGLFTAAKKVTLGRGTWTGGSATTEAAQNAKTVFMNCQMDAVMNPSVWNDWDSVNTAAKCFFREYKNTGDGANASRSTQLTEAEAKKYANPESVLGFKPGL